MQIKFQSLHSVKTWKKLRILRSLSKGTLYKEKSLDDKLEHQNWFLDRARIDIFCSENWLQSKLVFRFRSDYLQPGKPDISVYEVKQGKKESLKRQTSQNRVQSNYRIEQKRMKCTNFATKNTDNCLILPYLIISSDCIGEFSPKFGL